MNRFNNTNNTITNKGKKNFIKSKIIASIKNKKRLLKRKKIHSIVKFRKAKLLQLQKLLVRLDIRSIANQSNFFSLNKITKKHIISYLNKLTYSSQYYVPILQDINFIKKHLRNLFRWSILLKKFSLKKILKIKNNFLLRKNYLFLLLLARQQFFLFVNQNNIRYLDSILYLKQKYLNLHTFYKYGFLNLNSSEIQWHLRFKKLFPYLGSIQLTHLNYLIKNNLYCSKQVNQLIIFFRKKIHYFKKAPIRKKRLIAFLNHFKRTYYYLLFFKKSLRTMFRLLLYKLKKLILFEIKFLSVSNHYKRNQNIYFNNLSVPYLKIYKNYFYELKPLFRFYKLKQSNYFNLTRIISNRMIVYLRTLNYKKKRFLIGNLLNTRNFNRNAFFRFNEVGYSNELILFKYLLNVDKPKFHKGLKKYLKKKNLNLEQNLSIVLRRKRKKNIF